MPSLLILDDESHIVDGYRDGIDWGSIGISPVFGVDRVSAARLLFEKEDIDILLSDIEMPGQNGLSFAEWARSIRPTLQVIFLTGHPDFEYARQALRLESFDYLLKPVSVQQLLDSVARAAEKVTQEIEQSSAISRSRLLEERWKAHRPKLIRHFWKDFLNGKTKLSSSAFAAMLSEYQIPLTPDSLMKPYLITHAPQDRSESDRITLVMDMALTEALTGLLEDDTDGIIIPWKAGASIWLHYTESQETWHRQEAHLAKVLAALSDEYGIAPVCYSVKPVFAIALPACIQMLVAAWSDNVSPTRMFYNISPDKAPAKTIPQPMASEHWLGLLEDTSQTVIHEHISKELQRLTDCAANREQLLAFCHLFLGSALQALHKNGLLLTAGKPDTDAPDASLPQQHWLMIDGIQTIRQAGQWAHALTDEAAERLTGNGKSTSALILKAQVYIKANLHDKLTRDAIASFVFLHPNYLSKLFRNEIGMTLTDYIAQERLDKAKELLRTSDDKISWIAETVGIINSGYFARLFGEMTGMSPQMYRKKYQKL